MTPHIEGTVSAGNIPSSILLNTVEDGVITLTPILTDETHWSTSPIRQTLQFTSYGWGDYTIKFPDSNFESVEFVEMDMRTNGDYLNLFEVSKDNIKKIVFRDCIIDTIFCRQSFIPVEEVDFGGAVIKVLNAWGAFGSKLKSLNAVFDMDDCKDMRFMMGDCPMSNLRLLNLGKTGLYTNAFRSYSKWGYGSEENRQALVDSLLTYSYDRVSAGVEALNLTLHADVTARLTADEIAAIEAKGFII